MENFQLEEKVTDLEALLGHFISVTTKAINSLARENKEFKKETRERQRISEAQTTELSNEIKAFKLATEKSIKSNEAQTAAFSKEMKEFKDEMDEYKRASAERIKSNEAQTAAFSKEMKEFKDEVDEYKRASAERIKSNEAQTAAFSKEMKGYKKASAERIKSNEAQTAALSKEMKEFKDEMKEFKDEMKEFKDEMKMDRKNMTKQWGNISIKLGTIVEDLIAPAVRPLVKRYFGEDIVDFSVNRKKHIKSQNLHGEFDVIAASETTVYLVEVKATFRDEYLPQFSENITKFRKMFPEFNELKLIPMFASIRFEDKIIDKVTDAGFYAIAYRDWDYMDILNFEKVIIK